MKHDNRHKIIGGKHRALSRYYMILNRLKNNDRDRNRCYKDIEISLDKNEFVEWFMKHDFEGASVDRIDNKKGYSMDNIQLIPSDENMRKDRMKAKDGVCQCYRCKEYKPLEMFAVDKRRVTGHATVCKACDSKRKSRTSKIAI